MNTHTSWFSGFVVVVVAVVFVVWCVVFGVLFLYFWRRVDGVWCSWSGTGFSRSFASDGAHWRRHTVGRA